MLKGNEVMSKALQQETELQKAANELMERKREEGRINQMRTEQEDLHLEMSQKFASAEEGCTKLTVKLEKLFAKFKRAKNELTDVQSEFQREKEDILDTIRDIQREIRLKTLVLDSFVPPDVVQQCEESATWSDDEGNWTFQPPGERTERPKRPGSAVGCARPTTDFARCRRNLGPRFRYDMILQTDLDLPERFTADSPHASEIPASIRTAVEAAIADDFLREAKAKKPANTAPESSQAFPMARGLVAR